jgi:hypothetical protein
MDSGGKVTSARHEARACRGQSMRSPHVRDLFRARQDPSRGPRGDLPCRECLFWWTSAFDPAISRADLRRGAVAMLPGSTRPWSFIYQPSGTLRAGTRSRQQCRSGASGAEEKDAAGRHFPRNEDAQPLREAVREAEPAEGGSRPPRAEAGSQAGAARRSACRQDGTLTGGLPLFRLFRRVGNHLERFRALWDRPSIRISEAGWASV